MLKFRARAARLQARYEQTVACATPLRVRAEALRQAAQTIERSLTPAQLAELERARHEGRASQRRVGPGLTVSRGKGGGGP